MTAWIGAATLRGADSDSSAPPLVITHAALWTERGVEPDRELVLREGRVAAVGAAGKLARPAGARVFDAGGDTLLPGLIDAHLHFVNGVPLPREYVAKRAELFAAVGRQMLRSGVTAGRIHLMALPEGAALKRTLTPDLAPGPRIQLAGPGLFGGRPTWDAENGNAWGVKGPQDAAEKIRRVKDAGGDWIALHELTAFQPGELEAILAEAMRVGLRVLAAGDRLAQLERAAELDVATIDYVEFSETPHYPDELLAKLKARGPQLFFSPPIGHKRRFLEWRAGRFTMEDPVFAEFFPADVGEFMRGSLRENRTKESKLEQQLATIGPTMETKFRQLRAAGLSVAVATDCGSDVHPQVDAIWWELDTWVKYGATPHEALRAATTVGAALLGERDLGHLGVGARADFVLYRGAIGEGAFHLSRVRAVGKGGWIFFEDGTWKEP